MPDEPIPRTEVVEPSADELRADDAALRGGVGVVELPRDFVRVQGPDAGSFLQGQLSQDLKELGVGESLWSLLLHPQGKIVAFLRVARLDDGVYVLDADAGWAGAVVDRLNRFKLRVNADIEVLERWRCVAVRGPGARAAAPSGMPNDWPGFPGVDLAGPAPELQVPEGLRPCSFAAYEAARIEAGVPVMGHELNEDTIPESAGIVDRTVSFTKGCYTGQELVARIDSRGGNVPRRLRGVVIEGDSIPPVGSTLRFGEGEVGTLTSVARSVRFGGPVALAYVRRAVEPPEDVEVRWEGGATMARVLALPLVP